MARGQAMFLITAALPAIIGSLTLVLDVGDFYYNQTGLQTAADTAVLAGATFLPADAAAAESAARDYVTRNGVKSDEITSVSVASGNKSISMSVARTMPCYFCVLLGMANADARSAVTLHASATAAAQAVRSANGAVPLGVDYQTSYTYGTQMVLKSGQVGPGNWGPLAFGGTGASNYQSNVQNGYSGAVSIGDMVQTEPGNIVGPTRTAVQYRLSMGQNQYSTGTFQSHDPNDPRIMLIPLMDFAGANGRSSVQVMGFAVVWVSSIDSNGAITCYFIQQSVPSAKPDSSLTSGGATTPTLIG
ncbi:MAG TPA: Tad domain-containing protein [Candidatus Binataceae bacterium]|nr:Tad domain-containing protein [Candidatus Binataceae bacterium]